MLPKKSMAFTAPTFTNLTNVRNIAFRPSVQNVTHSMVTNYFTPLNMTDIEPTFTKLITTGQFLCKLNFYTEFHENLTNGLVADLSKHDGRRWSPHDMLFYCFKKASSSFPANRIIINYC